MVYPSFVKVAVTEAASVMIRTQSPVLLVQAPDQPVNVEPVSATAVNVTTVPYS